MPQEEILKEIKDKGLLKEPAPMKTNPQLRNKKKFCHFHRDHGHTTANCFELRKQLEGLFKDGLLQEYLYQPPESSTKKDKGKEPLEEVATIFGGVAAGPSAQARKHLVRQARSNPSHHEVNLTTSAVGAEDHNIISFSSKDAHGIHHPHCDALVLTVVVANKRLRRVLVDNGSSADIMSLDAFDRLGLNRRDMKGIQTSLIGFAGGKVIPEGIISLPMTLGEGPHQATKMVDFLVVDHPGVYNAILGRPSLYNFKAVMGVYHHVLKFPTPSGVGEVKGEQRASRECYSLAFKEKALKVVMVQGEPSKGKDTSN